jgi:hypothetical protein
MANMTSESDAAQQPSNRDARDEDEKRATARMSTGAFALANKGVQMTRARLGDKHSQRDRVTGRVEDLRGVARDRPAWFVSGAFVLGLALNQDTLHAYQLRVRAVGQVTFRRAREQSSSGPSVLATPLGLPLVYPTYS